MYRQQIMKIWRKLLLVVILIIFFYILSRFIIQRIRILSTRENLVEGFTSKRVESLSKANPVAISLSSYKADNFSEKNGIDDPVEAKRLRQYCIKSAYNAAYDGESVSTDMLSYVLSRGVRFIDLEVYWGVPTTLANGENAGIASATACVAYSADPYVPSSNLIPLSDVISHLTQYAFNGTIGTPNFNDPLFIQFRVKYDQPVRNDGEEETNRLPVIYTDIASIITGNSGKRFQGTVDASTPISSIGQKVVYIMDTRYNGDYKKISSSLKDAIHMETKSTALNSYNLGEIKQVAPKLNIAKDGFQVSLTSLIELQPVNTSSRTLPDNYDMVDYVHLYGCQIMPMMFHSNDTSLEKYERMFNQANCAFAPVSSCMKYLNQTRLKTDNIKHMDYPQAFGGK